MRILFSVMLLSLFSAAAANDLQIPVHYDTLGNGLRIIVVPIQMSQSLMQTHYFVGSMYEGPGTTGLFYV